MAKAMMMTVLDVSKSMGNPCREHFEQERVPALKIEVGLSFIKFQAAQMMLNSKTFELGVVTFGDKITDNYLSTERDGSCEGVREILPMARTNSSILRTISESIEIGGSQGRLDDGMEVGYGILSSVNAGKKFNKILLVITDGETPFDEDRYNHLRHLMDTMAGTIDAKLDPCSVYVILTGKTSPESSEIKIENAQLLQSVAGITNGRYIEVDDLGQCFPLFMSVKGLNTVPRPTNIVFEISPVLRIPCQYWTQVMKSSLPSLKKQGKSTGGAVKRDTSYRNPDEPDEEVAPDERVKGYKYGSQYVPLTTAEEDAFKVSGPQICQLLGFLSIDQVPRHHYLDSTNILQGRGESGQVGICSLTVAMRNKQQAALVRFVKKENADPYLAAVIPFDGADDGCLLILRLPCVEDKRNYMFPSLPVDSFVTSGTLSGSRLTPSQEQAEALARFIDATTVTAPTENQLTPFNPTLRRIHGAIIQKLEQRDPSASEAGTGVSGIPLVSFADPFQSLLESDSAVQLGGFSVGAAEAALKRVSEKFVLTVLEKSKEKKRSYWSDIEMSEDPKKAKSGDRKINITVAEGTSFGSTPATTTATQSQSGSSSGGTGGGGGVSSSSCSSFSSSSSSATTSSGLSKSSAAAGGATYGGPVLSAGSVSPAEDFALVVAYCLDHARSAGELLLAEDAVRGAMHTLADIVAQLVTVGGTGAHFRKAVACLKGYRKAALQLGEHERYNSFLQTNVKAAYSGPGNRHKALWDLVVKEGVTLVSSADDAGSSVAPLEAEQFLQEQQAPSAVEIKEVVADEDEDMFAGME